MNKKYYVDITQEKLKNEKSKMIMINQIEIRPFFTISFKPSKFL